MKNAKGNNYFFYKMNNHIMCDDVTSNVMQDIQRLASTLNSDPMSVADVDFESLHTFTNGYEPNLVVLLLVSISDDDLRKYIRDTIFDAIRMDNELKAEEMRENEQRLKSRLNEMWRQVTVRLSYAEKYKTRRNDALLAMLGEKKGFEEKPLSEESPLKSKDYPVAPIQINVNVSLSQTGDDNKRIDMSGENASYNETQIH